MQVINRPEFLIYPKELIQIPPKFDDEGILMSGDKVDTSMNGTLNHVDMMRSKHGILLTNSISLSPHRRVYNAGVKIKPD